MSIFYSQFLTTFGPTILFLCSDYFCALIFITLFLFSLCFIFLCLQSNTYFSLWRFLLYCSFVRVVGVLDFLYHFWLALFSLYLVARKGCFHRKRSHVQVFSYGGSTFCVFSINGTSSRNQMESRILQTKGVHTPFLKILSHPVECSVSFHWLNTMLRASFAVLIELNCDSLLTVSWKFDRINWSANNALYIILFKSAIFWDESDHILSSIFLTKKVMKTF